MYSVTDSPFQDLRRHVTCSGARDAECCMAAFILRSVVGYDAMRLYVTSSGCAPAVQGE